MAKMGRKEFVNKLGVMGISLTALNSCELLSNNNPIEDFNGVDLPAPIIEEDILSFINRNSGKFDLGLYRQIIGAANEFKEGDHRLQLAAESEQSRNHARTLLLNTKTEVINTQSLFSDELSDLIKQSTDATILVEVNNWTFHQLKAFVLSESEDKIKTIMPGLTSDVIGCLVKLLSNEELIQVGEKVFNPLPNSKIGSKGYLSARVQPNSPTDDIDDIMWQVFNAWSFAVGDLVLGTNPVSSDPKSVGQIEKVLHDILTTFQLEQTMPNCVLSHIDIQAEVEKFQPGTTGIWFQSLAGTVNANKTFDVTIEKMLQHLSSRNGQYGLYAETGQGADFTNGHGEGFDMVIHESRKYGFIRALKAKISEGKTAKNSPWVHVNDVAGFIGPEVFKTREQLVRCCLEDTVMGKLHGLTIGLDICSTLHMDVTLDDLDWCIEQVMPANPAYLMALPTKNDPMLSYLTTAFNNHVKIREQFGYKVNDAMWDFFKEIDIIDKQGKPTNHFGDPTWVYFQYLQRKGDNRNKATIYKEAEKKLATISKNGVSIARGYGENYWDLNPKLDQKVKNLYQDAKISLWAEMEEDFIQSIPTSIPIFTTSLNKKDYIYHPETGELLLPESKEQLKIIKQKWSNETPDIQLIISDGLNARALMDEGHLLPYLEVLKNELIHLGYRISDSNIVITHGRVRAGYACGELLYESGDVYSENKGIIHIIGERPGSGHHNFSAYITAASVNTWRQKGKVDHDISRVVSGISDTSLQPSIAAKETATIFDQLFSKAI